MAFHWFTDDGWLHLQINGDLGFSFATNNLAEAQQMLNGMRAFVSKTDASRKYFCFGEEQYDDQYLDQNGGENSLMHFHDWLIVCIRDTMSSSTNRVSTEQFLAALSTRALQEHIL